MSKVNPTQEEIAAAEKERCDLLLERTQQAYDNIVRRAGPQEHLPYQWALTATMNLLIDKGLMTKLEFAEETAKIAEATAATVIGQILRQQMDTKVAADILAKKNGHEVN